MHSGHGDRFWDGRMTKLTSFCGVSERTGSKPRAARGLHITTRNSLPEVGAYTETSREQR